MKAVTHGFFRVVQGSNVTNYYDTANAAAAYRDAVNCYQRTIGDPDTYEVQSYDWDRDVWSIMAPQPVYRPRAGASR